VKAMLGDRPRIRLTCLVCGALAVIFGASSLQRTGWTVDRVFHEFWVATALLGLASGSAAIGCTISDFWRTRPRKRDWAWSMAVALGLVATLALTSTHDDTDLGSLPAWVSAGGALFTAAGVVLALRSYRSTVRADLEDQANQVRLLDMVPQASGHDSDGKRQWRTSFVNRSKEPLYDLHVHGFRARVEDDADAVHMRAFAETALSEGTLIKSGGWRRQAVLEAGARFDIRWETDDAAEQNPVSAFVRIWYSVMDANGRYWNVVDNNEPEKVPRPSRRLG
jgi:hypothetical protein